MSITSLLIGLFFLITPEVSTLDILPDFIGCLFILKAIKKISMISGEADEAKNCFKRLLTVSAVKTVMFFPLISVASTDSAFYLIFATGFAILDLIFIIPAFHHLLSSLEYQAERSGEKLNGSHRYRLFTDIFFIVKAVLSVFPEIVYLKTGEDFLYDNSVYPYAHMKIGIAAVTIVLTLILGIVWFIVSCKFFKRVSKSEKINSFIKSEIKKIVIPKSAVITKSVQTAFTLLTVAAFCIITVTIDGVTFIPEFVAPILIIFALYFMKKAVDISINVKISVGLCTVLGIAAYVGVQIFSNKYNELANANFVLVKEYFTLPAILECIFAVSCIILKFFLSSLIRKVVKSNTGAIWEAAYHNHNKEEVTKKKRHEIQSVLLAVFATLTSISSAISYVLLYKYEVFRVINAGVCLVLAILVREYLYSVNRSVKEYHSYQMIKNN